MWLRIRVNVKHKSFHVLCSKYKGWKHWHRNRRRVSMLHNKTVTRVMNCVVSRGIWLHVHVWSCLGTTEKKTITWVVYECTVIHVRVCCCSVESMSLNSMGKRPEGFVINPKVFDNETAADCLVPMGYVLVLSLWVKHYSRIHAFHTSCFNS